MTPHDAPVPGMVTDAAEVARFAAEQAEDARRERWLLVGQTGMLLIVLGVVVLLVALQRS